MIATLKNVNQGNAPRKIYPVTGNKALAINLNIERCTSTVLTDLQAEIALASCNPQAFSVRPTSPAPTIPNTAFGSSNKMLNKPIGKISTVQPMPRTRCKPTFGSTPMISAANAIGDPPAEHHPREVQITPTAREIIFMKNTYAVYPNQHFPAPWEQHIHYNAMPALYLTTPTDSSPASSQSLELQLALPALPSSTTVPTTALDTGAINQSTSTANM
uniref:Uncharacterized protein n=1 Tax=Romanomermis culicivorax TaxID=13658 RepID=A0A915JS89_ROMCU